MLADIAAARSSILMEAYIFEDDEVGRQFIAALCAAARAGVTTTLRLDAAGSWKGLSADSVRALARAGVRLSWSRRWTWRRPSDFLRRNHRKLLIVDDRVAHLGGFNVHRDSSQRAVGASRWRDTHVRIEGALVAQAHAIFKDRWPRCGSLHASAAAAILLPNRSARCHSLRRAFAERFDSARERIWLTTPYFVPDAFSRRRLRRAATRGVDVRVLVPGKSDVPLAQWATRAVYARMLAAGVRLYEYQPRVLHAKTALVDHDWGMVGTANFDYRSFFVNDEVNLVAVDVAFNARLADQFAFDLTQSREIRADSWAARSRYAFVLEAIGWWARRWL